MAVGQTSKLSDRWSVRLVTDRRSRKAQEVERSGPMTFARPCVAANPYMSLVGRASLPWRSGAANGPRGVVNPLAKAMALF